MRSFISSQGERGGESRDEGFLEGKGKEGGGKSLPLSCLAKGRRKEEEPSLFLIVEGRGQEREKGGTDYHLCYALSEERKGEGLGHLLVRRGLARKGKKGTSCLYREGEKSDSSSSPELGTCAPKRRKENGPLHLRPPRAEERKTGLSRGKV